MLRIATSQIYQQSAKNMGERQVALVKVQQQMATGKRLLTNADDPVGSARLLSLNEEVSRYDQYQRNTDLANGRLNIEETILEGASEILQRNSELAIQANNGVLNDENRKAIAGEIRQLRDELLNLANTQDGNGEYLFAGFKSDQQPFTTDTSNPPIVTYNGDAGQRLIQAGPTLHIAVGDPGSSAFGGATAAGTADLFKTLGDFITVLETPGPLNQTAAASVQAGIKAGLTQIDGIRAKIGARMNALDDQQNVNGDFAVHLKQTISDIGDLDYAEAATRLSQETLILQAAQQSFIKIQGLSLFNYMR